MYNRAKYIISEDFIPVVFSELQKHNEVARALFGNKKIVGAGYVSITSDCEFCCYGESTSLQVKSRGDEDSKILNHQLGGL